LICEYCGKEFSKNRLKYHINITHLKLYSHPLKGKTKETSEIVRKISEKIKGRDFGFKKGCKHSEQIKIKISNSMKGNKNANHRGDRQSYYKDIRMDSSWECGVAYYLDLNKINWKYSKTTYVLSNGCTYTPDFFIYSNNKLIKIIEVKGYFREQNKRKFKKFIQDYPNLNIEIWDKDILKEKGILNYKFVKK
jgi:hypothetical protein